MIFALAHLNRFGCRAICPRAQTDRIKAPQKDAIIALPFISVSLRQPKNLKKSVERSRAPCTPRPDAQKLEDYSGRNQACKHCKVRCNTRLHGGHQKSLIQQL
jgi:hypothetical protein